MGQRLWASLCAFVAFIALVVGAVLVKDGLASAARRAEDLRSSIAALQEPAAVCTKDRYGYGPNVHKLLSLFQVRRESGLVFSEIGSVDNGVSWKELRRFDPPLAREALPERLGEPGQVRSDTSLTAQFKLLDTSDCAKRFAFDLNETQASRMSDAFATAGITSAVLMFVWLVYRWGLWLVRGTWRTRT